jgi:exosortase
MLMPDHPTNITSAALADNSHSRPAKGVIGRLLEGWTLGVAALAVCWIQFFNELRSEWEINPQYNYGCVVPLLGAMLVWRRWPERPSAAVETSGMAGFLGFVLVLFLLPVALIREANPEWRLLYWSHAVLVLSLSFCLLYHAGGWSWVKFFAPPLVFMLIAVPWPMEWEQEIIQGLMRFVAGLTIQVVDWFGIPAVQHGNLIEVGAGVVGINEACSGIRSLQSGLMLSLFFGEMFRFSASRRMVLIGASLACVLLANVGRTTFLTWVVANRGIHQMETVHDTAGLLVMLFVLPSLFILAHLMRPQGTIALSQSQNNTPNFPSLPRWVGISVFIWIVVGEIATEAWYRGHEQNLGPSQRWSIVWPAQEAHFEKTAVPEESLAILRCSNSDSARWKDDEDNQWSAFFLRWDAGKNSAQLAKGHRPEICFPAAGAKLVETYGTVMANANGLDLPFKYQTFQAGDRLLHVFFCLWSDRASPQVNALSVIDPWSGRMHSVLAGQRNLGQQVFEVVINGPETSDAAISLFRQQLPRLIRRD